MSERPEYVPLQPDAPPDFGLLLDALEALTAGRLPPDNAREEVIHLIEHVPGFADARRRAAVLQRVDELLASGEYSRRAAARRVSKELHVRLGTVRDWMRTERPAVHGWNRPPGRGEDRE